jgi:hypothetical protein
MRVLLLMAMLLGVALTSCAATLPVQFTMPTQGNSGTCASPTLVTLAAANPQAVIRYRLVGEPLSAERETTFAAPLGSSVRVTLVVPNGDYWIRAWAVNDGVAGCADSVQKGTSVVAPWKTGGIR